MMQQLLLLCGVDPTPFTLDSQVSHTPVSYSYTQLHFKQIHTSTNTYLYHSYTPKYTFDPRKCHKSLAMVTLCHKVNGEENVELEKRL